LGAPRRAEGLACPEGEGNGVGPVPVRSMPDRCTRGVASNPVFVGSHAFSPVWNTTKNEPGARQDAILSQLIDVENGNSLSQSPPRVLQNDDPSRYRSLAAISMSLGRRLVHASVMTRTMRAHRRRPKCVQYQTLDRPRAGVPSISPHSPCSRGLEEFHPPPPRADIMSRFWVLFKIAMHQAFWTILATCPETHSQMLCASHRQIPRISGMRNGETGARDSPSSTVIPMRQRQSGRTEQKALNNCAAH